MRFTLKIVRVSVVGLACGLVCGLACGVAVGGEPVGARPSGKAGEATPSQRPHVASPHPLITEVLFAVPKGEDGDADQSGMRSATGDEFIEIYNPHATAIELKGYVLTDAQPLTGPESAAGGKGEKRRDTPGTSKGRGVTKGTAKEPAKESPKNPGSADPEGGATGSAAKNGSKRSRLRFEFPALTLKPGEVAVVFNGFESRAAGVVGSEAAAAGKNEKFGNAYVLSMGVKSQFAALANEGDCVTLFAPDGRAIQCVRWGEAEKGKKIDSAMVMMEAPVARGSVALDGVDGAFIEHPVVEDARGRRWFSPGTFGTEVKQEGKSGTSSKPGGK